VVQTSGMDSFCGYPGAAPIAESLHGPVDGPRAFPLGAEGRRLRRARYSAAASGSSSAMVAASSASTRS